MAEDVVDHHDAALRIEARGHRPFDIRRVADIDVVVDHGHHLERRKRGKGRHQGLLGPSRALLRNLHHGVIETAAAVGKVNILHPRHLLLQQGQHIRLAEQSHRVEYLDAGENGMKYRLAPAVNFSHAHQRTRCNRGVIARHLGERAFLVQFARTHFALEGNHRVGHHFHRGERPRHEFERPPVKLAGNAQFVGIDRRRLSRRGGGEMQSGSDADVERERQGLAAGMRFFEVGLEVAPGIDVDREAVLADHHEALDRGIAHAGFGIPADHHCGVEIRTAIELAMRRNWQAGKIDRGFAHLEDRPGLYHHRFDRPLLPGTNALEDMLRQRRLRASEQVRQQFARPIQAGENRDAAAFDLLEQHRARPAFELGGDGRELVGRVDLGAHANQPSPAVEPIDNGAQIGNDRYAGSIAGHALSSYAAPLFLIPSVR